MRIMLKKKVLSDLKANICRFCMIGTCFLVSNSVSGTTTVKWDSDGNMFTVQASSSTIRDVLNYIEENSDYIFVYDEDVQSYLGKQVNISLENKKIDKVLDDLFAETSLSYAKNGR